MSTENQIPSEIAQLIEQKTQEVLEAKWQKEEAQKRQEEEIVAKGKAAYDEYFQAAMQKVPEFMRPYFDPAHGKPDFERIGKNWARPVDYDLWFSVPGLAFITFSSPNELWQAQSVNWSPDWDESPNWGWRDPTKDVALALAQAKKTQADYQKFSEQYAQQRAEKAQQREEYERKEAEHEARAAEEANTDRHAEQSEEEILFDVLRNDAVAMYLLKAYLLINEERQGFRQQIENYDEAMYSMENRWSRRAEELRRQADEADRRAEDERSRLQSDLDDAEAKLKKAERGW